MRCTGRSYVAQLSSEPLDSNKVTRYDIAGGYAMKYKIALRHSEEGYSVSCPGLSGCWSQGETEEEAIANIQEAIREYLAARDESLQDEDVREIEVPV